MHPYVVSVIAACWILSAAIACALVRGARIGKPHDSVAAKVPPVSQYE